MILITPKWPKSQVHHTSSLASIGLSISLPSFLPLSSSLPPHLPFLSAENALRDAGLSYSAIQQAVVGYVYGTPFIRVPRVQK